MWPRSLDDVSLLEFWTGIWERVNKQAPVTTSLSFLPGKGSEPDLICLLERRGNEMIFLVSEYSGDVKFTPITPSEASHFAQDTLPSTTGQFIESPQRYKVTQSSPLVTGRESFVWEFSPLGGIRAQRWKVGWWANLFWDKIYIPLPYRKFWRSQWMSLSQILKARGFRAPLCLGHKYISELWAGESDKASPTCRHSGCRYQTIIFLLSLVCVGFSISNQ